MNKRPPYSYVYPGKLQTEIFSVEKSKEEPDFIEAMKEMLKPLKELKDFKIVVIKR